MERKQGDTTERTEQTYLTVPEMAARLGVGLDPDAAGPAALPQGVDDPYGARWDDARAARRL
ncbi:MAG TPA: hypothetical protein VKQ30_22445 [Ktedonobacterales bacterium]|nr:hypothetical protein [Ktedonobacterales bacterium]